MSRKKEYLIKNFTYAERVTAQYKRILSLLEEKKANFFNEFIRGASLLDGIELRLLSKLEGISDTELSAEIEYLESNYQKFIDQFGASSIYEAFENILRAGRTKIFIWKKNSYQQVNVDDYEQEFLPWAGEIRVGGPSQSIVGVVSVARDYDVILGNDFIEINGHRFE